MSYLAENIRILKEEYGLTLSSDARRIDNLVRKELDNPIVIVTNSSNIGGILVPTLHGFSNIQAALQKLVEDMLAAFSPDKEGVISYRILESGSTLVGCILQGRPVKLVPSVTGVAVLVKDEAGDYSILSGMIETKTIEVINNERQESETAPEISPETDGEPEGQTFETGSYADESQDSDG